MSSRASRLAAPALGLKEFMRRSQVIQQYRCFLRALRAYGRREPTTAAELREQVCRAFRRHRDEAAGVAGGAPDHEVVGSRGILRRRIHGSKVLAGSNALPRVCEDRVETARL